MRTEDIGKKRRRTKDVLVQELARCLVPLMVKNGFKPAFASRSATNWSDEFLTVPKYEQHGVSAQPSLKRRPSFRAGLRTGTTAKKLGKAIKLKTAAKSENRN